MNRWAPWVVLVIILTSAFALRVGYCLQIQDNPFFEPVDAGLDTFLYDAWAQSIANGDWVGTDVFSAMPGYPYFLGIIYSLFGRNLLVVRLIQALFGSASCFLIFLIAKRHFGNLPGLISAFLAATYQMLIFHDGMLVGSTLSMFLISAGLYLLTMALEKPRWWRFAVPGVVLGAAILTHASTVLFVLFVTVWIAWRKNSSFALIFFITVLITISPVTIRNYMVAGDFVPITAHGGINFYIGNNASSRGVYQPPAFMLGSAEGLMKDSKTRAEKEEGRRLKPSEISRFWFRKGMSFIRNNPSRYLALTIRKVGLFINVAQTTDILNVNTMKQHSLILRLPLIRFELLFPLAAIGIFASWPLLKGKRLLCLFLASQLISCCLFFVNARYRLPTVIVLSVFAGYAVFWVADIARKRDFLRLGIVIFAGILAGIVSHLPLYRQDNTVFTYNVALAYQKQGRFEEAEKSLLESVRLNPRFAEGYNALGFLCWQLGRKEEATAYYKKAVAAKPHFAEALYNLGYMSYENNDLENAQRLFEKALSIKPDYRHALMKMGQVCGRRGNYESARKWWLKVLQLEPDSATAQQQLELLDKLQSKHLE